MFHTRLSRKCHGQKVVFSQGRDRTCSGVCSCEAVMASMSILHKTSMESSLMVVDLSPPSEPFPCEVFTRSVCSIVTRDVSMQTSPSFSVSFLSSPQAFWALVVEAQISAQFSPVPRNSWVPRVRGVARWAPHRRPEDCRVPPGVLPRFLARCSRSHRRP